MCNKIIVFNYSFSLASLGSLPNNKSFNDSDNESDGPSRSTSATTTNKNSQKHGSEEIGHQNAWTISFI